MEPVLATSAVSRRFGIVHALSDVSIAFRPGEVHGIVGENGAGKSTLLKILSGVERPDGGRVLFRGTPVALNHPLDAQRLGISMIHQELNLVDELTVAENIFLGREKTILGLIKKRRARIEAERLLNAVRCEVSPDARVMGLSIATRQMVEIAKAISVNALVLIMDEPTAVLTRRETTALFDLIAQLSVDGVSIVFVSHILPEILQICDRVTVMRDGRVVETIDSGQVRQIGERGLASKMVGRPMADHFPPRESHQPEIAIEVRGLSVPGKVKDVSFSVRRGEILGFAGLVGAGRTEMAEAICGLRRKSSGEIVIDGKPVAIGKPRDAVRAGLAYLSEDRKGTGLTMGMSVAENTTMISLKRYCHPLISRRAEDRAAQHHVRELSIKLGDIHDRIDSLSGGNQQKVALAKWLEIGPRVLIMDEPTRGVDIGAKEQIYHLIQSLTQQGMACILISSELNEVISMSHRIAVMRSGRLAAILDAGEATEDSIMQIAAGVAEVGT